MPMARRTGVSADDTGRHAPTGPRPALGTRCAWEDMPVSHRQQDHLGRPTIARERRGGAFGKVTTVGVAGVALAAGGISAVALGRGLAAEGTGRHQAPTLPAPNKVANSRCCLSPLWVLRPGPAKGQRRCPHRSARPRPYRAVCRCTGWQDRPTILAGASPYTTRESICEPRPGTIVPLARATDE